MSEEAELQAESARIEHMLSEVHDLVPRPAWDRIEDVLARIVRIYGEGLGRALGHARAQGVDGPAFDRAVCADELLASLLVLHGLHPLSQHARVERALAALRDELGLVLEIAAIADGIVQLTAKAGSEMSAAAAEATIRRVVETAAPETTRVEIRGLPVARDATLVQLRRGP